MLPFLDVRQAPGALAWLYVIAVLAFIAMMLYGAGLRGTDQYWYVDDVETLLTSGQTTTNNIFPVELLRGTELPLPFVHNVIAVYLAAVPGWLFGSYWGWLSLNLISTLLSCWLIFLTSSRFTTRPVAVLTSLAYLVFPLTFWLTMQPLGEASIVPLVVLGLYILARAGRHPGWWLALGLVAGLLALSRHSLVLVLAAVPLAYAWLEFRSRSWSPPPRQPLLTLAGLGLIVVGFLLIGRLFFPEAVETTYVGALNNAVPGYTGTMTTHFNLAPVNVSGDLPIRFDFVLLQVQDAFAKQFFAFPNTSMALLYWGFNLLAAANLVALWRFRDGEQRLLVVAAGTFLLLVHLLTIAVHHNQVRYTLLPLPALLISAGLLLDDLLARAGWQGRRLIAGLALLFLLGGFPFQVWAARISHQEAAAEARAVATIGHLAQDHVAPGESVMAVWEYEEQGIASALRPNPVLFVRPHYTLDQYRALLALLPARWLIAEPASQPVTTLLPAGSEPVARFDFRGRTWGLFRLPPG